MKLSFRSKLLLSHGLVVIAAAIVAAVVVRSSVRSRMQAQVDRRLLDQANAVARWLERAGHPERLARRLAGVVGARVTIVGRDGRLYGESIEGPSPEPDVSRAPEIAAAREGRVGRATRYSAARGEEVRYVAVEAPRDLIVRIGLPIGEVEDTVDGIVRQLGIGALISLAVAAALAMLLAAALSRRLRDASALAKRVAVGDYEVGAQPPADDEVGVVARTLADAAAELRATDQRRREFLANVAHELRTPVTSISGFAQTLNGSEVDADTRREFLATIDRNARRISRLVDDLLELEALAHGHGPELERGPVKLMAVAENVVGTLAAAIAESGASVSMSIADDLRATGDEAAVERILLNLVDNALRHGGGGSEVEVEISAVRRGERVLIAVTDSGPGVPEGERKRIFERFRHAGPRAGGLGLAIARELSRAMDGDLRLEDAERGARFVFELPGT